MKFASEVRNGEIVILDGTPYKVISAEKHAGTAKMQSVVHLKLRNIKTGNETEKRLRPDEKIEETAIERKNMEFIYSDEENYYFMDQKTFEQIPIHKNVLGPITKFIQPNTIFPVEFLNGEPINVISPETINLKVSSTGAAVKGDSDAVWKSALLENGMEINVPPFIQNGDTVKVNVYTGQYVERVKEK